MSLKTCPSPQLSPVYRNFVVSRRIGKRYRIPLSITYQKKVKSDRSLLVVGKSIASNPHLNNVWCTDEWAMNYLAKQEYAVTLSQILQEICHPPTELLKAIQSLKRRCLLEDTPNYVGANHVENYQSGLLKINPIFENYLSSLPLLPT